MKKIKDSIFNPDENLYKIFEEKFESLKNYDEHSSDLNSNKFYSIQYAKETTYNNFKFANLYEDIFWFSKLSEQIEYLFQNQDNMNSILKILISLKSGFETKNLAKFLSERLMRAEKGGNLTNDNLYKCLRMLRSLLLIRLYNHGINLKDLSKIFQMFNSKIKRNKISNEEFYFTFEVAKKQNDND